jgi:hypothetical protein
MKLYAIYVGGHLPGANIELHDMRFVAAPSIAETYDELRRQWWGKPAGFHIDCWAELDHVDGYDVSLRDEPFPGDQKLFYVNLGGYNPAEFSEQHKNMFVVASTIGEAKSRALKTVRHWRAPHRDDVYEAEQAFSLDQSVQNHRLHVHLTPREDGSALKFTCEYRPIRSAARAPQRRQGY